MTDKRTSWVKKHEEGGEAAYREPNRICATCGRPTATKRKDSKSGYGDFHYTCRRDSSGHLIVRPA